MRTAFAFLAGAFLGTFAPLAGAMIGAALHDRNMRSVWEDWE
jgi:hypothetical protein